ncbi:hypothetical protein B296_00000788 [Ensete ventricosum]|uniref:Uncharacterized protein n=1 Tax=Ensete ventricosum TaxID=4639 RepID=A0A427B9S3_ENSVE|nr:hypothetical protein B296_00000788 [Ensete ventricosum]
MLRLGMIREWFQPIRGLRVRNGVRDGERDRIPLAPYLLCEISRSGPNRPRCPSTIPSACYTMKESFLCLLFRRKPKEKKTYFFESMDDDETPTPKETKPDSSTK